MRAHSIAFLGLGTMGGSMARQLLLAGHELHAFNRSPGRREKLAERVASDDAKRLHLHEDPRAAVESAEVIISCMSDDAAIESLFFGEMQCLTAIREGSLLIDCATTSLEFTEKLAVAAQKAKIAFVDAPMTGSLLGAQNGTLTFMAGGGQEDYDRAKPFLDTMGKHVVHVGPNAGAGQSAKCCLNMSQAVVLQGVLEGYALAKKLGVSLDAMAEIFEHSAGKTGVGSFKTPYLQRSDYTPHFRLDLMQKDLHLALEEASGHRLALPAAQAVRLVYDQGVAEGWGEQDFLVLAKLLERWGDFSFHSEL